MILLYSSFPGNSRSSGNSRGTGIPVVWEVPGLWEFLGNGNSRGSGISQTTGNSRISGNSREGKLLGLMGGRVWEFPVEHHWLNMHIELVLVCFQHVHGMRHQSCDTPTSPAFTRNVSYLVSNWSCDHAKFSFLQPDDCCGA